MVFYTIARTTDDKQLLYAKLSKNMAGFEA